MTDFEICKRNLRRTLVADEALLKSPDEATKNRLLKLEEDTERLWRLFRECGEGERVAFFKKERPSVSWDMSEDYRTLRALAYGFGTYGNKYYKNEELLADILFALEWGYNHYYGKAEMEGRGWRSTREFNWHDWKIATPRPLMDILVIIDGHLPLSKVRDYLELFNRLVPVTRDYGANKVNFGRLIACSGILCEDEDRIRVGIDGIADTFLYADGGVNDGQGFYRDGSYIFHTRHAQTGLYGVEHLEMAICFALMLSGSRFKMDSERTGIIFDWVERAFLPHTRYGTLMSAICGRYPEDSVIQGSLFLGSLLYLYEMAEGKDKDCVRGWFLGAVREHPLFHGGTCPALGNTLTLYQYSVFRELLLKGGEGVRAREGMHSFGYMDRAVWHGEDYAMALAMSSSRIYNYECINSRNLEGWYQGDGMLYLYNEPYQYDFYYFRYVDHYRIPGTTVDNRPRAAVSIAQANEYLSGCDFVASLDCGDCGIAVMQYESYRSDGKLVSDRFYKPTGEYGSLPPKHDSTLSAKKAYFFLDGYAVMLGADINSSDNAPVYTILDNRKGKTVIKDGVMLGYETDSVYVNGKRISPTDTDESYDKDTNYVNVGAEGIVIFDASPVTVRVVVREVDTKTRSVHAVRAYGVPEGTKVGFTEVLYHHGINPKGATYAYALIPNTTPDKTRDFYENPPFEILSNTAECQMIRVRATGDILAVFHSAATCHGITADKPLLCAVKKDGTVKVGTNVGAEVGKVSLSS
ncbi:MAG: hypothetical protein IJF38_00395 [Clostridia bacterium]|nr:hypothetical protein [Clostridia bacterium]